MPHVADGILHAYLDGALDALSDAGELQDGMTTQDVVSHLTTCADCRARLDAERDVRQRAGLVLRAAALPDISVPPFGDIASAHRTRRSLRWLPMSWAASVLLAVGAGWWGSALWRTQGVPGPAALEQESMSARQEQGAAVPESDVTAPEAPPSAAAQPDILMQHELPVAPDPAPPAPAQQPQQNPGLARAVTDSVAPGGRSAESNRAAAAETVPGNVVAEARSFMRTDNRAAPGVQRPQEAAVAGAPAQVQAYVTPSREVEAFDSLLARAEAGRIPFRAAADAEWPRIGDQLYVIADASDPEIEIGREIGQTTVRVRQTLPSGAAVELITWQQSAVALDALVVTGLTARAERDTAVAQRAVPDRAEAQPPRAAESAARRAAPSKAATPEEAAAFMVSTDSPRTLSDGRRELVLRATSAPVWIAIRASIPAAELQALMHRLTKQDPPR